MSINHAVNHAIANGKRSHKAVPAAIPTWNGTYDGAELRPFIGRPGAMDAFNLPSVIDGKRVYPRGASELKPRVFHQNGTPLAYWSDDFQAQLEHHPKVKEAACRPLE